MASRGFRLHFVLNTIFVGVPQSEKANCTYRLDRCVLVAAKHRMHSKCDELVAQAWAAIGAASGAPVADVETSAALRVPRPAAMADTSADSDTVIRSRAGIAWASVASPMTMVFPAAFARNALLECLRGRTFDGKC